MNLKGIYTVADYIDQGQYYPNMSFAEIDEAYNGIGADWMPAKLRKRLDKRFHIFRDAIIIHDCDYERGLTKENKIAADKRLRFNLMRCAWRNGSLAHPWELIEDMIVAQLFYYAVRDLGGPAFWSGKTPT